MGLDRRGGEARYVFRPWNVGSQSLFQQKSALFLFYCLEEQFAFVRGISKELIQGRQMPVQYLYLFDTSQRLHVQDGRYLVGVSFDTPLGDQIAQKFPRGHTKVHFFMLSLILYF